MAPLQHSASGSSDLERTPVQSQQDQEATRRASLRSGEIPASVGGYEILRSLGEGSFGTVWLARERKTGRQVAIKFFTNRRGLDWSLLTREVEKLAVLDASRDVVRLLDVGVDHDPPYFVMEFLPNRSVATLLEEGPLPVPQAIEVVKGVARALVHAHSAGILHCDIKPGNVLLDRGNEARLGDFGQSRLATDQGSALGTFYFMAPEQASRTANPDVRWDVYALGALFYTMLTGSPPYQSAESETKIRSAKALNDRLETYRTLIAEAPFPNEHRNVPGVDASLADLIDRCLQRNPAVRTPNAQVILDQLEKRELSRAQRPLIWLGILGPILTLLTLLWVASRSVPVAVGLAEKNLTEMALASNSATARLLASSIEQELLDRQADLERLSRLLLPREGDSRSFFGFRNDLIERMDRWAQESTERLEQQSRTIDESLFLTDANGIQIYRFPWTDSIGGSYAYRDYFHGLGRELSPQSTDVSQIRPRQTPGISSAFRSTNTGQYMVAVAVPVWNADGSEVLGILARTIHIGDLLEQWENRIRGGVKDDARNPRQHERLLSLVDLRESPPLLLDHDWIQEGGARSQTEAQMTKVLSLTPQEAETLLGAARTGKGVADYHDPLADQNPKYAVDWLASVAHVPGIDWLAIVQERRDEVVTPMSALYGTFLHYGLIMLLFFVVMLVSLWWLYRRAVKS